jgi:hypothetical protein
MNYRKLRIAWSIAWGFVGLLLIVMWARSHYVATQISVQLSANCVVKSISQRGYLGLVACNPVALWDRFNRPANLRPDLLIDLGFHDCPLESVAKPSSEFKVRAQSNSYVQVMTPWWSIATLAAIFLLAPQRISWQFSLRTLLVAMTLVAVGLGWIFYWVR